jgi:hypothetical protein
MTLWQVCERILLRYMYQSYLIYTYVEWNNHARVYSYLQYEVVVVSTTRFTIYE